MVVVSISAMLLGLLSVGMHRSRINRQVDATSRELLAALRYARQIAFTNNGTIFAVTSPSGQQQYYTVTTVQGAIVVDKTLIPSGLSLTCSNLMNPLTFGANGVASAGGTYTVIGSTGRTGTLTVVQQLGAVSVDIR